jgi:hypothetical protein
MQVMIGKYEISNLIEKPDRSCSYETGRSHDKSNSSKHQEAHLGLKIDAKWDPTKGQIDWIPGSPPGTKNRSTNRPS